MRGKSVAILTENSVTAMLLTGGAAVVTSLTGMNTVAACFLLPIGVIIYTLFGGIKYVIKCSVTSMIARLTFKPLGPHCKSECHSTKASIYSGLTDSTVSRITFTP